MKKLLLASWLVLSLSLGAADSRADQPGPAPRVPLEAFFGLPNVQQPRLSPDGSKIAFLFPHEGRMALGVFDRAVNSAQMILKGREESLAGFFWKGNDRLVFYADVAGNESFFIAATDLTGKRVLRLAESQSRDYSIAGASVALEDELVGDPDRILVRGYFAPEETAGLTTLNRDTIVARLNIRNKALAPLMTLERSGRYQAFVADQAGRLRLRSRLVITKDRADLVWEHRAHDDAPWREIARHPNHGYAPDWQPLRFAADNQTLYLLSREEHDRGALYAYNTATLERGPAVFVPPAGEIDDIILSQDRTKLLGVAYETDRRRYHWVDPQRAVLQAQLEATFPGLAVRVTSQSADEQVCLIWVGSDREPGVYFVLDKRAGSMTTFKRIREIDPATMQPMEPVKFTARDGLELHGYLTRPAGSDGKKTPLIIHPHGGPFGVRDSWGFNPEVQFLVNRGYAVLQVNYRGSGGYGRAFLDRGRQQWGRAMQDDLTDAVKWAIAQGIADPARVAIYGASYGGYAALAGVTLTPDLYRCAVNYVGAADLEITFKDRGDDAYTTGDEARFGYQSQWVGPTKEYRDATSPVNFVDRIRVPTMHVYGRKDPRVKIDHWSRLEPLLKKYGKPYVSIEEKKQGHGFRDEKASAGFYAALEKFLAENLAPGGR
jgi:dipeptidyl aminopeptidase/acylaminoacyl peptidase